MYLNIFRLKLFVGYPDRYIQQTYIKTFNFNSRTHKNERACINCNNIKTCSSRRRSSLALQYGAATNIAKTLSYECREYIDMVFVNNKILTDSW